MERLQVAYTHIHYALGQVACTDQVNEKKTFHDVSTQFSILFLVCRCTRDYKQSFHGPRKGIQWRDCRFLTQTMSFWELPQIGCVGIYHFHRNLCCKLSGCMCSDASLFKYSVVLDIVQWERPQVAYIHNTYSFDSHVFLQQHGS